MRAKVCKLVLLLYAIMHSKQASIESLCMRGGRVTLLPVEAVVISKSAHANKPSTFLYDAVGFGPQWHCEKVVHLPPPVVPKMQINPL